LFKRLFKAKRDSLSARDQNIWKTIIAITLPAFIELVMSTLFGMVDMVMVGQIKGEAGKAGIAAIGLTNQPFFLLFAVFAAVNVGTTTLVAWNIGAGNQKKARSVSRQILLINIGLGLILSLAGILAARYIIAFMGGNEDTMEIGTRYFQIISAGLVFQAVTAGVTASLRGAGETKIPMLYNLGANFLNVIGNYILIYGKLGLPELGVQGAAISTTISKVIACTFALYVLFSKKGISRMSIPLKGNYRLDFSIIKQVFNIGFPAAIEQVIIQSGLMMFARTVSVLGTAEFAAHQIGLNINGLTFAPSMAFGVAATTLVGQSLGANKLEDAQRYSSLVHRLAIGVACFVGLNFIIFSYPMARIYTSDLEVARMAGTVLKIVALAQLGMPSQLTLSGVLRGAGDTMYPLYASAFGIWFVRVLLAHVFVHVLGWGLIGAWVALVLDQYTRGGIIFLRYRSGKWKYIKSRTEVAS